MQDPLYLIHPSSSSAFFMLPMLGTQDPLDTDVRWTSITYTKNILHFKFNTVVSVALKEILSMYRETFWDEQITLTSITNFFWLVPPPSKSSQKIGLFKLKGALFLPAPLLDQRHNYNINSPLPSVKKG